MMIVDATGLVMGRLASVTAKRLLAGEEVKIVNIEKVIVTGRKERIFEDYGQSRQRGTKERGPYFPRRPDRIMTRTIRGMLPYKMQRGRDAMSKLRVFIGVPRELKGQTFEQPRDAMMRQTSNANYVELGVLSKRLGADF